MATKQQIQDLLPKESNETFDDTVEVRLGISNPKTWLVTRGHFELLQLVFPHCKLQVRNEYYPAFPTWDENGERVDVSLRRALKDLEWREKNIILAKGFTVEPRDGNKLDLRTSNLRAVPVSKKPRKNGWKTHYIIGVRLAALLAGCCPDEAMSEIIAKNLERAAANDNRNHSDKGDLA